MTDLSHLESQTIRIAIVSDTHSFIDPRILDLVSTCHAAIHAGDIGSSDVLESLKLQSDLVFAVTGNNDVEFKWEPSEVEVLNSLSDRQTIVLSGGKISVEHGHTVRDTHRYHEVLRKRYPDSRAVVYGHTHERVVDQSETPWVLNPGAAGRNRTRGGPSCLILEAERQNWSVTEHCFQSG